MFFDQARNVPDSHRLVQGCRHNQVLFWMELGTHDVVVMAGQTGDFLSVLPIPDSDCLVVRGGNDPWQFVVEEHRSDIVQVSCQGEHALSCLR